MSDVLMGFIHYVETFGGESRRQLLHDKIAGCHGVQPEHFPESGYRFSAENATAQGARERCVTVNAEIRQ
jgi:hypothetical protein